MSCWGRNFDSEAEPKCCCYITLQKDIVALLSADPLLGASVVRLRWRKFHRFSICCCCGVPPVHTDKGGGQLSPAAASGGEEIVAQTEIINVKAIIRGGENQFSGFVLRAHVKATKILSSVYC